jgi:hypothetical protein
VDLASPAELHECQLDPLSIPLYRRPHFCRQTYIVATMCGIDLATTLWFCGRRGAAEANPLMSGLLAASPALFIACKIGLTAIPLTFLEWVRLRNGRLAVLALNTVIIAYLVIYVTGVLRLNGGVSVEETAQRARRDPAYVRLWSEMARRIETKRRQGYFTVKSVKSPAGGS